MYCMIFGSASKDIVFHRKNAALEHLHSLHPMPKTEDGQSVAHSLVLWLLRHTSLEANNLLLFLHLLDYAYNRYRITSGPYITTKSSTYERGGLAGPFSPPVQASVNSPGPSRARSPTYISFAQGKSVSDRVSPWKTQH